jgi:hypothetical protein
VTRTTPATEAARAQPSGSAPGTAAAAPEPGRVQPAPVQPPPVEPVPAAPGQAELGTLVSSWPAVVEFVRQENAMLAATLETARPVTLNDQALTLAFPAGAAFFKRKAEQDDYRRAAAEAVRSVTGARLTLRYELRDDAPVTIENGAELTGEELVQRFMEEFDAEEVLDDDPDQEEA